MHTQHKEHSKPTKPLQTSPKNLPKATLLKKTPESS